MNLIPLVSSNLWAARMRPRFPSLIRSARETPWFWYFLATETTKRRLLRTSLSRASSSFTRMRCARRTSSSWLINGYRLISRRYWSSEPSSNEGVLLPLPTCIGRMSGIGGGCGVELTRGREGAQWGGERGAGAGERATPPRSLLPAPRSLPVVVDLRPLQRAAVVGVADLGLRVELVHLPPALAVAVAGLLDAAEGEVRLRADGRRVDVGDPVVQVLERPEGQVDVPGVDRAGEAVLDPVVHPDRLVVAPHPEDAQHRAEDLLLGDPHGRLHAGEDRGPVEPPPLRSGAGGPLPAQDQLRPLLLPDLHVPLDLLPARLVDQGPHVGGRLEPGAQPQRFGGLRHHPDELVVDLPVHDQPAGGGAALSGGAEGAPQDAVERQVQVGVVHHDHGVLAAHLERQPLVHPAAGLADPAPGVGGPGERDERHFRVLDQRLPRLGAAVDQLDH